MMRMRMEEVVGVDERKWEEVGVVWMMRMGVEEGVDERKWEEVGVEYETCGRQGEDESGPCPLQGLLRRAPQ